MDKNPEIEELQVLPLEDSSPISKAESTGITKLLDEYEEYIKALRAQVEFYKVEQGNLHTELIKLINENQELSEQLRKSLHSSISRESIQSPRHRKEADMVTNIQRQLALTTEEKDSAIELWRSTTKEVENLEDELKTYQDNRGPEVIQKQIMEVKYQYSAAILALEESLVLTKSEAQKEHSARERAEAELARAERQERCLLENLRACEAKAQAALEGELEALSRLGQLEVRLAELAKEGKLLKESRAELESALECCHGRIDVLASGKQEAMDKVQEAVTLVESSATEREVAISGQAAAKEENGRLQAALARLIEEAGVRVREESELIKAQYNEQLKVVLKEVKQLQQTVAERDLELEKERRDRKAVDIAFERAKRDSGRGGANPSLLEHRLESAYRDLSRLESANFQLTTERDRLGGDIGVIQDRHTIELQQREAECRMLGGEVSRLQADLEKAVLGQTEAIARAHGAAEEVQTLRRQLGDTKRKTSRKNRDWLMKRHEEERNRLLTHLEDVKDKSFAQAQEFQRHLDSQTQVKNKWQTTVKTLVDKYEDRLLEVRSEAHSFKKLNRNLQRQLGYLEQKLSLYQDIPTKLT